MIRAASGEEGILNELSGEDILSTQFLVIGKIVMQDSEIGSNIERFLDEAEELVAEWEQEEQ